MMKMRIGKLTFIIVSVLLAFSVSDAQLQPGRTKAVRVMTFNIRVNLASDGVNAWPNRASKVASVIRFHKADLVGLQEALVGQLHDLERMSPDFSRCGVGRADGKDGGEFSAIMYRKSRFTLKDCKTFWLSETPEVPGSMGWDAAYPRIVTYARLFDRATKREFYHFNTHFDHRSERARVESAKLIKERIASVAGSLRYILTGDLNVTEDSDAYKILAAGSGGAELKDARFASVNGHFGGTSSFNGFKELEPGRKIDYIFVKPNVPVLEHGILSDRWDGLWASDHLPVLAEIIIY